MAFEFPLPTRQRLSTKIVGVLLGFLSLALLAIGTTLVLSRQLEGSSAAINETGSLRMRNYRLAVLLGRVIDAPEAEQARLAVQDELKAIEDTFMRLQRGDPQRPLALPPSNRIQDDFRSVSAQWSTKIRMRTYEVLDSNGTRNVEAWKNFQIEVERFVREVDALVKTIEHDSEMRTFWLRASQMTLMALALSGTAAVIYLLFLLIVKPVERLRVGMQRMTEKDFGARLAVESNDEFGLLTRGFNRMADRLEELYNSLEQRVTAKTAALEAQNRELALLYDSAEFLQRRQMVEAMCEGFLQRIRQYFAADAGSIRMLDDRNDNMHMLVHQGMPADLVKAEHCMKVGQCLCGEAVEKKIVVIRDFSQSQSDKELLCHREGFATVWVFHVVVHEEQIGFISLHFRTSKQVTEREQALAETLGQMLGTAIENMNLASREREMAISEERNLVAQGLHDSIAQGLTFMNLQLQMLDDSLRAGKIGEVAEIVPALRAGVQESYEDVRELLVNFRSRLAEDDLIGALKTAVEKFRRHTGLTIEFIKEGNGPPFSREQQLQVLFIVQEAMSNIRKHAMASHVEIRLHDSLDFVLTIRDDGIGFDAESVLHKDDGHVGINIMRERAQRIQAFLEVSSAAGKGTTVSLLLTQEQRRAA